MKSTIVVEIECPEGYKPVYDEHTGKIQIAPDDIKRRVKSVEDALHIAKVPRINSSNKSINVMHELQVILDVLNEGHKFNLIKGKVWYPWVKFYKKEKTPKNAKVAREFCYKGDIYALVGGATDYCFGTGLGDFESREGIGYCYTYVGSLACKDLETAKYVSEQFACLIFEACFLRHFDYNDFQWL